MCVCVCVCVCVCLVSPQALTRPSVQAELDLHTTADMECVYVCEREDAEPSEGSIKAPLCSELPSGSI